MRRFSFSGVKGINLGFSETGVDAGFGRILSEQVISDAFEIVKSGSEQPQIFQLVGLFEEGVAADRLSDMIATLISDDIHEYTRWVNDELNINGERYPEIQFEDGIAINPYKGCELLYLPVDILHELPIAKNWNDIDRVISENRAIRNEVNAAVGEKWRKMASYQKKRFLKEHIFQDKDRCARVIDEYERENIDEVNLGDNSEYFFAEAFKKMRRSGVLNFLEHSDKKEVSSWDAAIKILDICKEFIELNKGWDIVHSVKTNKGEKTVQRLLHNGGAYYCRENNIDMSFEANEGPGPVDLKVSRGNDKTVVEIKLSTNNDYLRGFTTQIEEYAKAEHTDQRIFVYVQMGRNPIRDTRIKDEYEKRLQNGENPPLLYVIDSRERTSASVR